jgi:hypothetical protein
MKFKENCIHLADKDYIISESFPEGVTIRWCTPREGYIKGCPINCKNYDFTEEIQENEQ